MIVIPIFPGSNGWTSGIGSNLGWAISAFGRSDGPQPAPSGAAARRQPSAPAAAPPVDSRTMADVTLQSAVAPALAPRMAAEAAWAPPPPSSGAAAGAVLCSGAIMYRPNRCLSSGDAVSLTVRCSRSRWRGKRQRYITADLFIT